MRERVGTDGTPRLQQEPFADFPAQVSPVMSDLPRVSNVASE